MTIKDLQRVALENPCIVMQDQDRRMHSILLPGPTGRLAMLTLVLNVMRLQCDMVKWSAYVKLLPAPPGWSPSHGHPFLDAKADFIRVAEWTASERDGAEGLVKAALDGVGVCAPFDVREMSFCLVAQTSPSDAELDEVDAWILRPENAERWLSLHPEIEE